MSMIKGLVSAAALAAGLLAATPSAAVITTFASFSATPIVFKNSGTGGSNATYTSNGTGGTFYTTTSAAGVRPGLTTPGTVATTFSFLQAPLAPYCTNCAANFTFFASTVASPAQTFAGFDFEQHLSGSFSFTSVAGITIHGITYHNLLTGTFTNMTIAGAAGGSSGGASASTTSTPAGAIVYTSDFLSFVPTTNRDLSISLSAIVSRVSNVDKGLNFVNGKALRSFRATSTGSFSTDPAPLITVLPEPETWGLMIAGFGMVGLQARRRARSASTAA